MATPGFNFLFGVNVVNLSLRRCINLIASMSRLLTDKPFTFRASVHVCIITSMENLPPYIDEEVVYDDPENGHGGGEVYKHRFFLNINRTSDGNWACGYIHYASDEEGEMAIPRLVINDGSSLKEIEIRMKRKLNNWYKIRG